MGRNCMSPAQKLLLMSKMTLVLLLGFLQVSAAGYSQKKISVDFHNASTRKVFHHLTNSTSYVFYFNNNDFENSPRVNLAVKDATVPQILDSLKSRLGIHYKVLSDHLVVITRGDNKIFFQEVTGTVTDNAGTPLVGVTIQVKGTNTGTVTNAHGQFSLDAPEGATLVVSYIGYETREIQLNGRNELNIVLDASAKSLNEVVVVGYGTQKRKEITSAITKIDAEDFNKGGVTDPMQLIQGKVAGLTINNTQGSNPNAKTYIQLRSVTSLSGTNSPLIVIDGIPGGNLDLLQQDDIASITVLKDGSAAAIYGTRANGGVILVTTKKGQAGEPKFQYSTYFQHEVVDKRPNNLNASEFRDLIDKGLIDESLDMGATTDLYDTLINHNNLSQYHYFSATGGSEKTNYRASVYYNDAEGIAKANGRSEFGGRVNVNQTGLQDRLNLQLNLASNINSANLLGGGTGDFEQAVQRNPTAPIRDENGEFVETFAYNNYNPISRLANRIDKRQQQTFSGSARLTFDITDDLTASAFGSYQRNNYNDRQYRSMEDWEQREGAQYQGMGYAYKLNHLNWAKTFESTIDYSTVFGQDHSFSAMVGYSYQYQTVEEFWVNNNGFTTDAFKDWNLGAGSAIQNVDLPRPGMDSYKEDNTLIAFFGRLNYAYKGKYFAQFILRHEGSSRFGVNHKWGSFPAASLGWAISEEDFMQDVGWIDNLKLRAGFGVTGNQGIDNYQSIVTLSTGGVYPQNGVYYQTYGPARNPNPDLKWERKEEWNIGLDFAALSNRLTGSINVYQRNTVDLLYNYVAQLPPYTRDSIFMNVGSVESKGLELQVSYAAVQTDNFSWTTSFVASTHNNVLDKLSNEFFKANYLTFAGLPSPGNLGPAIRIEEGSDIGDFYGKRFAGFTDEGKWLFYKADGSKATADQMSIEDETVIGNGIPKYNAAWSNRLRYKNFDLTIFFRGKFGFDLLNLKQLYFGNKKWLPNNVLKSAITTHKELNDDPQYSDYYLEDGSFVKLDNVTLGYNFPIRSSYVRNLRLYVTGRHLATFTGYSGLDPEQQDVGFVTGIDSRGFYPRTMSFTVGLNVGF